MAKTYFFGKIFPQCFELSIPSEPIQWDEGGVRWRFLVTLDKSNISLECDVVPYSGSEPEFSEAYRRALDVAKASLAILSFARGYGLTVILDEHTDVQGERAPIIQVAEPLSQHCTIAAPGIEETYREILALVLAEPPLLLALNDLVESISTPHISAVNCARVVEGLRHIVAPTKERAQQWRELQSALGLSHGYLQPITEISRGPRHGERAYIPAHNAWDVINRAWVVMNRFLEYRKRKNTPLCAPEFPILT